jgi:uncharacterized phage protein (TIGR02218 family)
MNVDLHAHLATGHTTVCRCWKIVRTDGATFGFTDHDGVLAFDGVSFAPETGLTAMAIAQSTGLSVDNSEAVGALRSDAISEADLLAGRYDGAEVTCWLVNWQDPTARMMQFRGHVGEVTRAAGAFRAELRGLAEDLNRPQGRVYQRQCAAVLGDAACKADMSGLGRTAELDVTQVMEGRILRFEMPTDIPAGHLARGRVQVLDGAAKGMVGIVKTDTKEGGAHILSLWQRLDAKVIPGDRLRLEVGCDKSRIMCRDRFSNVSNFRGFPHIPGEDWLMSYPAASGANIGGSLFGGDG